jgi:hypothetical protein
MCSCPQKRQHICFGPPTFVTFMCKAETSNHAQSRIRQAPKRKKYLYAKILYFVGCSHSGGRTWVGRTSFVQQHPGPDTGCEHSALTWLIICHKCLTVCIISQACTTAARELSAICLAHGYVAMKHLRIICSCSQHVSAFIASPQSIFAYNFQFSCWSKPKGGVPEASTHTCGDRSVSTPPVGKAPVGALLPQQQCSNIR